MCMNDEKERDHGGNHWVIILREMNRRDEPGTNVFYLALENKPRGETDKQRANTAEI